MTGFLQCILNDAFEIFFNILAAVMSSFFISWGSLCFVKDSFINLDQDLLKVVKIFGQVESTVQVKITQKWI